MIIANFIKGIEFKYKKHYFSGICFDSSKCKKDNIFFAIKGTKIDGNKFINHAIQKGAKTIISNQKFEGIKKNILFIKSSNVRKSHVGRHVSPCSDNQNGYLPRQSQDTRFKRLVNKGVRAVCRPLLMTVLMLLRSLCWVPA
jgi:hypothetical protein